MLFLLNYLINTRNNDFFNSNIFKKINPKTRKIVYLEYLGIDKIYNNVEITIKKSKNKALTKDDKKYNKNLSKIRVKIEHVNRHCNQLLKKSIL